MKNEMTQKIRMCIRTFLNLYGKAPSIQEMVKWTGASYDAILAAYRAEVAAPHHLQNIRKLSFIKCFDPDIPGCRADLHRPAAVAADISRAFLRQGKTVLHISAGRIQLSCKAGLFRKIRRHIAGSGANFQSLEFPKPYRNASAGAAGFHFIDIFRFNGDISRGRRDGNLFRVFRCLRSMVSLPAGFPNKRKFLFCTVYPASSASCFQWILQVS